MCVSVQTLYKDVVERLRGCDELLNVSSNFSSQSNDAERVGYAYSVLRDLSMLPNFDLCEERLKQENVCVELRNKGNACFQQHKDSEALLLYTQSIASCPLPLEYITPDIAVHFSGNELELVTKKGSCDLAYAYANRSAVLFAMQEYRHCLLDIARAERLKYPDHLMYKLLLRKAKCLIKLGDGSMAQQSCADALELLGLASGLTQQRREALELEIRSTAGSVCGPETGSRDGGQQRGFKEVKLASGRSGRLQCASDCIDVERSEGMGRSIVATRDLSVGDVVLMEEPFAAVLLPRCFYTHCFNCFRRCPALVPCLRCSKVMFCDELCREASWKKSHRFDCFMMSSLLSLGMGKFEMLSLRVVVAAATQHPSLDQLRCWVRLEDERPGERGFDENGLYVSTDYRTVYHIVGNTEKRTVSDLFERSLVAGLILELLARTSFFSLAESGHNGDIMKFVGGLILRHLQNLPCNAHEISEYSESKQTAVYEQEEIGAAAYATLSLVNHSCDPNVVRVIHGGRNALVVIRPMCRGEQVLDNYGYHYAIDECDKRKSSLEKQYFFTCLCEACEQGWPTYHLLPSEGPTFRCPNCRLGTLALVACEKGTSSCTACRREVDVDKLTLQLQARSDAVADAVQTALEQPSQEILDVLTSHLEWLDRHVQRPWKLYNNCQEAIKHLWFCRSSSAK